VTVLENGWSNSTDAQSTSATTSISSRRQRRGRSARAERELLNSSACGRRRRAGQELPIATAHRLGSRAPERSRAPARRADGRHEPQGDRRDDRASRSCGSGSRSC
jgi:hypothetical protein